MTDTPDGANLGGTLSPQLISSIETSPVSVITEVLRATGPGLTDDLLGHQERLVNKRAASRAAARHSALTLYTRKADPTIALTKTELKQQTGVTVSALSQTTKRINEKVDELAPLMAHHPLIAYIRDSVGRLARLDQLPRWIQKILTVHPAAADQPWGSPEDIAQFVGRLALGNKRLVPAHDSGTDSEELWITPGGEELTSVLDEFTDTTTNGYSTLLTDGALQNALTNAGVVPRHCATVMAALTSNKNIIWIPSGQRYVAFHRQPAEQRRSRGSAKQRATDIINLMTDVTFDTLVNDIVNEFAAQHRLDRSTAENAVRGLLRAT
jgi:hypothetical protein